MGNGLIKLPWDLFIKKKQKTMESVCLAPSLPSSCTSLLPQLSALFTLVLEAGLFPSLGEQQTKNRCVVQLLEMDPADHLCTLDLTPSKGALNALPLFEAIRTLTHAKKAYRRNNESPDTQELQPTMVTKDGCQSAFHTVLWRVYQWHTGFPGTYLVYICCPSLIINRILFQSISKEIHSR